MNIKKITPFLLPTVIFLLSFILRLSLICKGPFHLDCLNLALKAQETLATGCIQPLPGFGYPLTVLLGALFIKITRLFGNTDPVFAVNLMSVLFGALSVWALFLFVQRMFDKRTALFSSVLFSFYPFFFGVSLYGKSHAPAIFFLLMGLWLLNTHKNTARPLHLALSAFCFGLMAATRLQDLILMVIPLSVYFLGDGHLRHESQHIPPNFKTKLRNYIFFISIILILIILFHLPLLLDQSYQTKSSISWFWKAGLTSNFIGFFSPHLPVSLLMLTTSLSLLGIILAISGLSLLFKRNLPLAMFLFLWFAIPIMFYGNLYTTTSRFLIISAMPLIIAEGYALAYLTNSRFQLLKTASILSFGLIIWITFKEVYPVFKFRHENAPLVDFSRWVSSTTEPDAVIIATDDRHFIKYYGQRETAHNPCGIYQVDKSALPHFQEWLDNKLALGVPIYITYNGLRAGDRTKEFRSFMLDNYTLYFIGQHLSEDWHSSSTRLLIGQDKLYKIMPKDM